VIWNFALTVFQIAIESGPHAGHTGFIAVRQTYLPFDRLPIELRQSIYKLLFTPVVQINGWTVETATRRYEDRALQTIGISRDEIKKRFGNRKYYASDLLSNLQSYKPDNIRVYSMLLVNRALGAEAKEFLYRDRRFKFTAMGILDAWLKSIGDSKRYLTSLTVASSTVKQSIACYRQIVDATHLERFSVTLPGSQPEHLGKHIDKHWDAMSRYLLAGGADETESLRRVGNLHFAVGKSQRSVLSSRGEPITFITLELNEWCRDRIRGLARKHFAKSASERHAVVAML
jgi:hypothetical protein